MKSIIKIIIVVFLLIISIQNAFALGVAPARKVINFNPWLKDEVTLSIFNTQNEDINIFISKQGELSEYITLSTDVISLSRDEKIKNFTYKVSLPQKIDEPGDHDVEIIITEVPKLGVKGGVSIGGRAAVVSQLRIKVPYPGKYAKADLYLEVLDDDVSITIPIFNLGTDDIIAKANIKILGKEELANINTDSVEVKAQDKNKITMHWSAPSVGSYRVVAEVYYDDKVIKLEREFDVGEMFVKVVDVLFGKVKLGEVAKFDIIAQSGWNKAIKNVYADVLIKSKEGYVIARLKTASDDIDALSKEKLTVYWDTQGVGPGFYDLITKLNYSGKISEKGVEVNLEEVPISPTKMVKEIVKPSPITKIIIIVCILVIIFLIIIIYYLRMKEKVQGELE